MKTSENTTEIFKALFEAQKAITSAAANAENTHHKNRYADLQAVIQAVKPALNGAGILFIQSPEEVTGQTYVLNLTTRLVHVESGQWVENTASIPMSKGDPQGFGSALTYGRRYNLSSLIGLYQEDDDGNDGSPPPEKQRAEKNSKQRQPQRQTIDVDQKIEDLKQIADLAELRTTLAAVKKQLVAAGLLDDIPRVVAAATAHAQTLQIPQGQAQ